MARTSPSRRSMRGARRTLADVHPFVVECARRGSDPEGHGARQALSLPPEQDWGAVVKVAASHGVASLAYRAVMDGGGPEAQPLLGALSNCYMTTLSHNVRLLDELSLVLARFIAQGVESMPLKGAYLASAVYGDPGLRPMVDLDVLVHREAMQDCERELMAVGYAPAFDSRGRNMQFDCVLPFVKADDRTLRIEIHWELFPPQRRAHGMHAEHAWGFARTVELEGVSTLAMPPEQLLLYLCAHMASDQHCFERLIWLCDVAHLLRTHALSWEVLVKGAAEYRLRGSAYLGLLLSSELVGAPVPTEVLSELAPGSFRRRLVQRLAGPPEVARGLPDHAKSLLRYVMPDDWRTSAQLLREKLEPPHAVRGAATGPSSRAADAADVLWTVARGIRNVARLVWGESRGSAEPGVTGSAFGSRGTVRRRPTPSLHRRPKVLSIATDLPWPLDSGWRIRAFENLRAFSSFCDVTLLCFVQSDDPGPRVEGLREALRGATVLEPVRHLIHIKENPLRLAGAMLRGLLTGRPYKVAKFSSSTMRRRLAELRDIEDFDLVHVELATSVYAERLKRRHPKTGFLMLLDEHNVESDLLADHCRSGEFGLLSVPGYLECWRTRRFEAAACARADLVITISQEDLARLAKLTRGMSRFAYVPPVVAGCEASRPSRERGRTILFVGTLSWLPNAEAVRWFCERVLPLVRAEHPDVLVQLVGAGATPDLVQELAHRDVDVLGYVDDISEVFARASVFVAPFLTGGGVRIKLLDAMRAGVPIVSTTTGAKGLQARSGTELLVADSPEGFAAAVSEVLSDPMLAERLAAAARGYLAANHSRQAAETMMREAYGQLPPQEERVAAPRSGGALEATAGRGLGGTGWAP